MNQQNLPGKLTTPLAKIPEQKTLMPGTRGR